MAKILATDNNYGAKQKGLLSFYASLSEGPTAFVLGTEPSGDSLHSKQYGYALVIRIARDNVGFAVLIDIADGKSPGPGAGDIRRVRRWSKASRTVAEHYANAVAAGRDDV